MTEDIKKSSLVTIRDGVESDLPFIYSSWLKGLRWGNSWFEAIEQDVYFPQYHKVLEGILDNPSTTIRIASLAEDPDVILGYAVLTGEKLHWVFVKRRWRGIGLATDLVAQLNLKTATHVTDIGLSILKKKPGIKFNPFAL